MLCVSGQGGKLSGVIMSGCMSAGCVRLHNIRLSGCMLSGCVSGVVCWWCFMVSGCVGVFTSKKIIDKCVLYGVWYVLPCRYV